MYKILDLGAGTLERSPGHLRADLVKSARPHVVMNAEAGFPFRESAFERVECWDLVEHIGDIPGFMQQVHRVLKPSGTLFVTTPHFSCANSFTDPTHRHHCSLGFFDYFDADHPLSYYSEARFRIKHKILRFHGGPIDAVVRRIAQRFPEFYEHRLCWIFPAWYLEFELEAIK